MILDGDPISPVLAHPASATVTSPPPPPPPPAVPKGWKTEPEHAPVFAAWQADRSPANGAKLLQAIDPIVRSGVKTFAADGGATAYGRARLLAMKSLAGYDPTKSSLRTYLTHHMQSLQRFRAGQMSPIKVPERMLLMRNTLRRAESDLTDQLGRPPSALELSDHTGLPPPTIAKVRSVRTAAAEGGFSEGYDGDSGYGGDPAVRSNSDGGWVRLVYHSVDPKDQLVLEHTLGLFGQPVLSTLAIAKKLGVTPAAVSQRKAKLQGVLDRRDELSIV